MGRNEEEELPLNIQNEIDEIYLNYGELLDEYSKYDDDFIKEEMQKASKNKNAASYFAAKETLKHRSKKRFEKTIISEFQAKLLVFFTGVLAVCAFCSLFIEITEFVLIVSKK